ncbi:MAG: A24 family peptidase [Candidatus Altimarinota bacterium]
MQTLIYIYLFVFGTLFGSFASVIIDRIKHKKSGIISGRSECPKCKHKLGMIDLVPIFSFLSTGGKCRYCKEKISFLYPILELSTGILFMLVGYFLIDISLLVTGNMVELYKLGFYLLFSFFTIVYVFYDILYLEIPDSILFLLISITFITIGLQSVIPNFHIIEILPSYQSQFSSGELYSLIGVGIFMIVSFYFIMLKGLKEIYDVLILLFIGAIFLFLKFFLYIDFEQSAIGSALIGSFFVFLFLFLQILVSGGTWMGGGDLRIAILMGLIAGISLSFHSVLSAYLGGSIVGILIIAYTKTRNYYIEQKKFLNKIKKVLGLKPSTVALDTKMPFGPFLALGIYMVLFFSDTLQNIINYL